MNSASEHLLGSSESVTNLPSIAQTQAEADAFRVSNAIGRAKRRSRNRAANALSIAAAALLIALMIFAAGYAVGVHESNDYFEEVSDVR